MPESSPDMRNIAVIGGGVSGITAALLLSGVCRVTLYEKEPRPGGHTHTVTIPYGPDQGMPVDMGFIVFNDTTYPLFNRLLTRLRVTSAPTDMSFGFYERATDRGYAGTSLNGLFATRSNLMRPGFWAMLREILRFGKLATRGLTEGSLTGTLGEFVDRHQLSAKTIREYLIPLVGAIWSASGTDVLQFPMPALASFLHNHGLLDYRRRPGWRYIPGGSRTYVDHFRKTFSGRIVTHSEALAVRRMPNSIEIETQRSSHSHDGVILAVHADTALRILQDPSPLEQRLLSPWQYSQNRTVLHTDISVMPPQRRHWAAWTVVREPTGSRDSPVTLHYHMNRLQRLKARSDYLVSLNPARAIQQNTILADVLFTHPRYDPAALATQEELAELNGRNRTWFCGAYQFHGFHEDGVRSAARVAHDFGVEL